MQNQTGRDGAGVVGTCARCVALALWRASHIASQGRVVKAVGHLDHVRSYGVREVVSSIPDRGNIVG